MPKILQSAYTNPYILETFLNRYIQFIDQDVRRSASPTFANVTITDSLNYGGVINRTNQEISDFQDNIILLNSGVDTTVTPLKLAGFEIYRGANTSNAYLKFDNQSSTWNVGLDGISTNLLASIPKPIDASLNNGTLIYNSATQAFTISNTFANSMIFARQSTYADNTGILFSSLSSGLTWFDGVSLTRNQIFDQAQFVVSPITVSSGALQLTDPDACLNLAGAQSKITFGSFNAGCIQTDPSSGSILTKNLNSDTNFPSLITDSINDAIPTTGPPTVSLRSRGAIFTNRSIYFGPQNSPSDAAPGVYQLCVPDITDLNQPVFTIRNVLNTVASTSCVVNLDASTTSECRFSTTNSGYAFFKTEDSTITIGSNDMSETSSFPINLDSPVVTTTGDLTVQQDLFANGKFIQSNGLSDVTVTLSDAVNSSSTTSSPLLLGAVIATPSQGWYQINVNLMFTPQDDNESSFVNILLPSMTQNIQDLSHIFCQILTAWRVTAGNMIPLDSVHILPMIGSQKVQIYFNSETTEAHYISASILYKASG